MDKREGTFQVTIEETEERPNRYRVDVDGITVTWAQSHSEACKAAGDEVAYRIHATIPTDTVTGERRVLGGDR